MREAHMMTCGHAANAVRTMSRGVKHDPPLPCCSICDCVEIDSAPPSLEGRMARCSYYSKCKHEKPSDKDRLAFFEYLGPGSRVASDMCKCGYYRVAHEKPRTDACRNFTPKGPAEHDRYYCGCMGWD